MREIVGAMADRAGVIATQVAVEQDHVWMRQVATDFPSPRPVGREGPWVKLRAAKARDLADLIRQAADEAEALGAQITNQDQENVDG